MGTTLAVACAAILVVLISGRSEPAEPFAIPPADRPQSKLGPDAAPLADGAISGEIVPPADAPSTPADHGNSAGEEIVSPQASSPRGSDDSPLDSDTAAAEGSRWRHRVHPSDGGARTSGTTFAEAPWKAPRTESTPRPGTVGKQLAAALPPALANTLQIAWEALARRDPSSAQRPIRLALQNARSHRERAVADRTQWIGDLVQRFWLAVDEQVKQLNLGDVFTYRGQPVTVVAVEAGEIVLQAADGDRATFLTNRARIDPELAAELAGRHLQGSGPAGWTTVGAFWAADAEGDLDRARRLWRLAAQQGWPTELLLAWIEPNQAGDDSAEAVTRSTVLRSSRLGHSRMSIDAGGTAGSSTAAARRGPPTVQSDSAETSKRSPASDQVDPERLPSITPQQQVALLTQPGWTIHWDNDRRWAELRLMQDGRWGYKGTVFGRWTVRDGLIVASFYKNTNWSLQFHQGEQTLNVLYYQSGKLVHRGKLIRRNEALTGFSRP